MTFLKKSRGFTLIELLMVVSVIALLAAMVFNSLRGAREGARISNALSFQHQMHSLLGADLVGWWNFDEGFGTTTSDLSGHGNNASLSDLTHVGEVLGTAGSAVNFAGTGAIIVGTSNLFNSNTFTISFWGHYRDYTFPKTFGAIERSSPNCFQSGGIGWDFGHGFSSSGIDFCIGDGVNRVRSILNFDQGSRPNDLLNKWTLISFIVDRGNNKAYAFVNGRKQATEIDISSVTGSISNSSSLVFGTLYGWQTDAMIDDIRIYSRALTAQEVETLYAQTKGNYVVK